MIQFIKENLINVGPWALFIIWFVFETINIYSRKKWKYLLEITILFFSIVCNSTLAYLSGINTSIPEQTIMLIGYVIGNIILLFITMDDFYNFLYRKGEKN